MTDAPERIWIWSDKGGISGGWYIEPTFVDDVAFIRADLTPSPEVVAELVEALRLADDALTEAEAILGGEYGDFYAPLCSTIIDLRKRLSVLAKLGGL